jgi:hypothetical protein
MNDVAIASRIHKAWTDGEISSARFVELSNDLLVGKGYDSPAGAALTRPGKSPLSADLDHRLAKAEHALAKLRRDPDGEEVAKATTVEKSDAMLKLERLGKKYAEENQTDFYDGFSVICSTPEGARLLAADKAERVAKHDRRGGQDIESYAMSLDGYGHHSPDPDTELNRLADQHMAEHNKGKPKAEQISWHQSYDRVAAGNPALVRRSTHLAMSKNA